MHQALLKEESLISYRIEPFYFDRDFSEIKNITGFRPLSFTKEMFYNHIDKLMFLKENDPSYGNQIGKSFQINWNQHNKIIYYDSYQKKEVTFPIEQAEYHYLVNGKKDSPVQRYIRFRINNIQLLISEMQVGFLVYDINIMELYDVNNGQKETLSLDLENHEWALYYLRKLQIANKGYLLATIKDNEAVNRRKEYFIRRKDAIKNKQPFTEEEPDNPTLVQVPIKWTDLTNGLLKEMGEVHSFTNQKKVGQHALLYTSAYIEPSLESEIEKETSKDFGLMVANKAYKISHGYRDTYFKDIKIEDIIRPFDNIMWSFSSEGVCNLVYTLPNEQTMKFFDETFKTVRVTNYYYMYVLALFQRYSLLYYTIKSSDLLFQSSVYLGEELSKEKRDDELKRTRHFYGKTLKFTIHGYYEQVSYHSHYNEIYEELIKALRIGELQQELSPKTEAFHQVIESLVYEQDVKENELKKIDQEKQNNIFQTITFILLPASLTTGILGMNIPFIANSNDFFFGYAFCGVALITALLSLYTKKMKSDSTKAIIIISAVLLSLIILLDIKYDLPNQVEDTEKANTVETVDEPLINEKSTSDR
ncbi:CorA family divalent cation transporter [Metabacillus halosaccharovorans]|uniref:CorA family divalent cation transporter n=1 Tax=Metabacillus halosaccharovorans TaxID=930124 RepID=UPI003735659D